MVVDGARRAPPAYASCPSGCRFAVAPELAREWLRQRTPFYFQLTADQSTILPSRTVGACQGVHDLYPHARSSRAKEAIVAGHARTEVVRQIAPRRPGSQAPEEPLTTRRSFTRGTPRGLFVALA